MWVCERNAILEQYGLTKITMDLYVYELEFLRMKHKKMPSTDIYLIMISDRVGRDASIPNLQHTRCVQHVHHWNAERFARNGTLSERTETFWKWNETYREWNVW